MSKKSADWQKVHTSAIIRAAACTGQEGRLGKDLIAQLMKSFGSFERIRREIRAALKFSPWLLGSLLLTAVLWRADLAATSELFQSPLPTDGVESPLATPTEPPTAVPTQVPTDSLTGTPEAPTATMEPVASPTPELPSPTATVATPTPTATATFTVTPTEVPPTLTPLPTATSTPGEPSSGDENRYPEGDSNLVFDWSMLVDSTALAVSYVWLCCGAIILVGIPVIFAVLWIASKRREQEEE